VDYLVNQSGYFPTLADLWKASMSSALSSPMENLKTWLKDTMNTEFADLYKDFANYMLFTDSSKLPIKSPVWGSAASNDGMIYDQTGNVDAVATAKPYASVMYGLKVRESKFMSVTWTNPNDGHVYVFFDEDGDQRSGNRAGYFLYANKTASFPMTDQTTVFILMVNPTSGGLDFNLTIGAAEADVYSVSIAYDKTDATCVENSAWGTPNSTLEIKNDNSKATIHYNSATDDYYWQEGAEHTIVATGSGSILNGKLEADLESTDTIKLGGDGKGNEVEGTVKLDLSFVMLPREGNPFYWDFVSAKGSSNVDLPATANKPAYSCSAAVKSVTLYPAYDFPLAR
jgi:hypothetical protein